MSGRSREPALARMLALGFFSGLPLPLSAFTLQQWFTTAGVSTHAVSLTATLGLSYTLKFLWAPVFDRAPPAWARGWGRRRFWLFGVQVGLALACAALSRTDPAVNLTGTAVAAGGLAFLSASQDIVIDAWRIESFAADRQGAALAAYVWGYRVAMICSGAGAIALSVRAGWHVAVGVMAALLALAPLLTLSAPEPAVGTVPERAARWWENVERAFLTPLREFLARDAALATLAFVVLFRLGKVFADNVAASFYRHGLGLGSAAVAGANFAPPLIGVFAGAAFGGLLVARLGRTRAVLAAGLLQAASLGLYLALLAAPAPWMLYLKVGGESFAGAAADTAFLSYISALCARAYTATQYALLSSLAALVFHSLGGAAGFLAEALGWAPFYALTMLGGLPALGLLLWVDRRAGRRVG